MISWPSMTVDEYAALELQQGARLVCVNGVWWRRVRPFFFRPLLPLMPLATQSVVAPAGWPAGFQHVVSDPAAANSRMSWLVLQDLSDYQLDRLAHQRRRLIKQSSRRFQVRRLTDPAELQSAGYAPYRSFYERSRYRYRRDRLHRERFREWAGVVGGNAKSIILGGFEADQLKAVSISYRLGNTLLYATYFANTEALRQNLGEYMFHELRRQAAEQEGLDQIVVRPYQGGSDHDRYYLIRGCQLLSRPARAVIPAPIRACLPWLFPRGYGRLMGFPEAAAATRPEGSAAGIAGAAHCRGAEK